MIVALAVDCLLILKHTKDRITVTPHSLVLTNLYTKTKHGKCIPQKLSISLGA